MRARFYQEFPIPNLIELPSTQDKFKRETYIEKNTPKPEDTVSTFLNLLQSEEQESAEQTGYIDHHLTFNLEESIVLVLRLLADGTPKLLAALLDESELSATP